MDGTATTTIMSRREAHAKGLVRFFTGKSCGHGHVSERYVSTGGCIACLTQTFKRRVNPWTKELEPYVTERLWCPATFNPQHRALLRHYLQRCIAQFTRDNGLSTPGLETAFHQMEERLPNLQDPREYL